ncbi:MAG TPA: VPLPA-CTERM sorting domain-containing protein [Mycobacterium sp.]|nr:VPLPA-CTERM sorting domain-containing protein [Mycobacterium sp.]
MSNGIKSGVSKARWSHGTVAALVVAACAASGVACADTVTFDWVQTGGSMTATGALTITSSLITAGDVAGTTQFNITAFDLPAGESFTSELTSLTFTLGGQTLTAANLTGNSTGWTDHFGGEAMNVLESTWTPSKTVGAGTGTLSMMANSTPTADGALVTATMGTDTAMGQWKLVTPVPLPASAWLLVGGLGALFAFRRRAIQG